MAATIDARVGKPVAARTGGEPIHTHPSDAKGLVDLDALKAAGLNCERRSQEMLAQHHRGERAQLAAEILLVSLADGAQG